MMFAVVLSVMLGAVGVVLWTEGGPTPHTPAAWLLLERWVTPEDADEDLLRAAVARIR